jgi:Uma2 family endonuclease
MTAMPYENRILLDLPPGLMNEDQFFEFCQRNDAYQIEREASGAIVVMEPTGFDYGRRNVKITSALDRWSEQYGQGEVGESSTGYTLPNGTVRAPDASWISHHRLAATTANDRERFVHAVPEFVAEVRSPSDRPNVIRKKMQEYIANGVLLAWYIDLPDQHVEIYRADGSVETVQGFDGVLNGEAVLPGFEFELKRMK